EMPRREALVLECLMRRAGRMVPRPALMEAVFCFDDEIQSIHVATRPRESRISTGTGHFGP
ncbi:DNA-binding response regulator, partial [Rhizobium johnstonii]